MVIYTRIINRLSFGCDESRNFLPQDAVKPSEEGGKVEVASDGKKKNIFLLSQENHVLESLEVCDISEMRNYYIQDLRLHCLL